jgi:hypothetical protein
VLTDEQIKQFQELYQVHFGEEMGHAEAMEKGVQLVRLMQLVYRRMTPADLERVRTRRKQIGLGGNEETGS